MNVLIVDIILAIIATFDNWDLDRWRKESDEKVEAEWAKRQKEKAE